MALVCIETLFSPVEAEIARAALEAAGIASLIGPGVSGIRLMVTDDDEVQARAALRGRE
jgi:hypothetical protein